MTSTTDIQPLVFKNKIGHWPASGWTLDSLTHILKDVKVHVRFGKRDDAIVQMETECKHKDVPIKTFYDWTAGRSTDALRDIKQQDYWGYSDYNRISEKFADNKEMIEAVDWSVFGFPGRNGKDSTLWMGSSGAYTVCHQDSYGCNLVAQIRGRKRWVLFPPNDRRNLYPTRLPFEESSWFSTVNILQPNYLKHPFVFEAHPYVVTLEPGDVLFVPRHWWHFVQNLDDGAIAINTWIDMPEDAEERTREALTKSLAYAMMSHKPTSMWLNPTEEKSTPTKNLEELNLSLHCIADLDDSGACGDEQQQHRSSRSPSRKRAHSSDPEYSQDVKRRIRSSGEILATNGQESICVQAKISAIPGGIKLQKYTFFQLPALFNPQKSQSEPLTPGISQDLKVMNVSGISNSTEDLVTRGSHESIERKGLSLEDFTDCMLDCEVIEFIRKKVHQKYVKINS